MYPLDRAFFRSFMHLMAWWVTFGLAIVILPPILLAAVELERFRFTVSVLAALVVVVFSSLEHTHRCLSCGSWDTYQTKEPADRLKQGALWKYERICFSCKKTWYRFKGGARMGTWRPAGQITGPPGQELAD